MKRERDWKTEPLSIDYVLDSGLLFKINQLFLHPFGIALTIKVDEQGEKRWDFKDCREAPETLLLDDGTFDRGEDKYTQFKDSFGARQIDRRQRFLGWGTQYFPPGTVRTKKLRGGQRVSPPPGIIKPSPPPAPPYETKDEPPLV